MYTTEYTCKVITPMLIHGADKKIPELRAPSIKGAMRFWWRVVNASICNEKLNEREQIIFGGINNNPLKSNFSINVEIDEKKKLINSYSPVPHKNSNFMVFGFSVGTEFTVRFSVNNKVIDKIHENGKIDQICGEKRLEEVENVFELLALCGGLGMRSRRGFGAFSIIKKNKKEFNKQVDIKHIKELINNIHSANGASTGSGIPVKTGLISIRLGRCFDNVKESLEHIGNCSHNARNINRNNNIQLEDIDDALGHIRNGRLASPIIVSVFKTRLNKYKIIITTLRSVDTSDSNIKEKSTRIQTIQNSFINDLI